MPMAQRPGATTGFAPSARLFTGLIGVRVWLGLGLGGGLESEFGLRSESQCDKIAARVAGRRAHRTRSELRGSALCAGGGFNLTSNN